ncbi:MAG: PEP-CTERM sorting domain-containing protein [Phycisphaerales bacterium]
MANRPYGQAGRLINDYKITIGQGVDEVVYDVVFVPEPATMMLIALGGLILRKRS